MKKTDGWMPLYVADYLADTARLTTEQHGAYLLLIMDYWRNGAPEHDEETLAAITRLSVQQWRKHAPKILCMFQPANGLLIHKRVEAERQRAGSISVNRSEAGKHGAAKRWGKDIANGIANGIANASQSAAQNDAPSPTPTTKEKEEPPVVPLGSNRPNRGCRLPEDFDPDDGCRMLALSLGISMLDELPKFRDFHLAKGDVLKDWQAGFRTWLRNAVKFGAALIDKPKANGGKFQGVTVDGWNP